MLAGVGESRLYIYEGQVVGGIGVSGLSEEEDVVLARLGLKAILGQG